MSRSPLCHPLTLCPSLLSVPHSLSVPLSSLSPTHSLSLSPLCHPLTLCPSLLSVTHSLSVPLSSLSDRSSYNFWCKPEYDGMSSCDFSKWILPGTHIRSPDIFHSIIKGAFFFSPLCSYCSASITPLCSFVLSLFFSFILLSHHHCGSLYFLF
jgi:hypothetical protein